MGFCLSFEAIWGLVASRLDFATMKMSLFNVKSTDVRLSWNLTGSLLESFWDDLLASIWMPWSRGALPPVGLILFPSVKAGSNVVEMTWNLTCSPLEACRSYPCALFDEWRHRWFSPPRGLISPVKSWWRVKRCRFNLKFGVEPFGGILSPSIGSDKRFDVFDIVAAGSSCLAVGGLKLGQMCWNGLKLHVYPFLGYFEGFCSFCLILKRSDAWSGFACLW